MYILTMFTYGKAINMRVERLKKPTTIWSIIIFVFSLWGVYATMNNRISRLEEFKNNVDIIKINTTLAQIQSDLEWIKTELKNSR